jgi:hypothetical protein
VRKTGSSVGVNLAQRMTLWVCLVFVTLVGSAQAAHICGLGSLDSSSHSKVSIDQMASGTDGICLICVASQPAIHPVSTSACSPNLWIAETVSPQEFSVACNEKQFTLCIRPPPAH